MNEKLLAGLGTIPRSDALYEASPDSLSELFSRDPAGYNDQDWDRVISEMRSQRERWAKAEAGGAVRAPRASKAAAVRTPPPPVGSMEDLGL